ncbi:MAG: hypothetical protein CMJ42_23145 [Phyllobacteriaceae bacterium]|nr:hypothetical protein [Phyllobacteriaceae bacterium]MBA93288.1 hypothetical protein [Phyllobacteriaceae bacterium]
MATYVVMIPPEAGREDKARLVRDGFSFLAFIVPPIWFAWHRLWVEALVSLALIMGAGALGEVAGYGAAAVILSFLVSLYAGLEARALHVASLERRGWRVSGVVEAAGWGDAELRWFRGGAAERTRPVAPPPLPLRAAHGRPSASAEGLGLIDYPGAR